MKKQKLTNKQLAFCREYVKNGYNGTQAAISAGYSAKGADTEAVRLLVNVRIKERIDYHKNNLEELCLISKAKLVNLQLGIVEDDTTHPITRQTAVKSLVDMLGYSSPVKISADIKRESDIILEINPFKSMPNG